MSPRAAKKIVDRDKILRRFKAIDSKMDLHAYALSDIDLTKVKAPHIVELLGKVDAAALVDALSGQALLAHDKLSRANAGLIGRSDLAIEKALPAMAAQAESDRLGDAIRALTERYQKTQRLTDLLRIAETSQQAILHLDHERWTSRYDDIGPRPWELTFQIGETRNRLCDLVIAIDTICNNDERFKAFEARRARELASIDPTRLVIQKKYFDVMRRLVEERAEHTGLVTIKRYGRSHEVVPRMLITAIGDKNASLASYSDMLRFKATTMFHSHPSRYTGAISHGASGTDLEAAKEFGPSFLLEAVPRKNRAAKRHRLVYFDAESQHEVRVVPNRRPNAKRLKR